MLINPESVPSSFFLPFSLPASLDSKPSYFTDFSLVLTALHTMREPAHYNTDRSDFLPFPIDNLPPSDTLKLMLDSVLTDRETRASSSPSSNEESKLKKAVTATEQRLSSLISTGNEVNESEFKSIQAMMERLEENFKILIGKPAAPPEPSTSTSSSSSSSSSSLSLSSSLSSSSSIISKSSPKPVPESTSGHTYLTSGAVKEVWVKSDDSMHVWYAPKGGNSSAEKELREEVDKAQIIKSNLRGLQLKSFMENFIGGLGLNEHTLKFLKEQPCVESLRTALLNMDRSSPSINPKDLELLRKCLASSDVKKFIDKAQVIENCLAIDYTVVPEEQHVKVKKRSGDVKGQARFTVQIARSHTDLEKLIRNPEASLLNPNDPAREKLISYTPMHQLDIMHQMLDGMDGMHRAGYVHGDFKPENMLVRLEGQKLKVKISDFGKSVLEDPGVSKKPIGDWPIYEGNTRFAPWENRLSQAGDVCAAGMAMIRILEEPILTQLQKKEPAKRMLIDVPEGRKGLLMRAANNVEKKKVRRGFEAFVIENDAFISIEADRNKAQWVIARATQGFNMMRPVSQERYKLIEVQKDLYLTALFEQLAANKRFTPQTLEELSALLRDMTSVNPKARPSMQVASERLEVIMNAEMKRSAL